MTSLCDANVWLALSLSGHSHHGAARNWFEARRGADRALFCRATQNAFLRLLTSAAVFAAYATAPLTNDAAWSVYSALLEDERVNMRAAEPPGVEHHWRRLAARSTASPKLWMDAYLAAFAVAGGHQLVTTDHAFRQFTDVDLLLLT